ncbi:3'-5' exonuclease [Granulosicoccus sp. 3-233]|uniref:3'-5' exonuclease n=1 Tax=Granulosicoccus sp. 3-233 TaxID=3417969 RepID=UPI003D343063
MIPIIVDIEASGFGSASYPIEVGLVTVGGQRHSLLIKPASDWTHWEESAEAVHRISQQTLRRHGRPVREVAETLNELLAGQSTYSDGWVVDKPWMTTLFQSAGLAMQFRLSPIEQLMSEAQTERWDAVKQQVLSEHREMRHRASYDAWVIQQTYLRSCDSSDRQGVG